ncbi:hypothetical protein FRC18_009106 [Serendipita sp. 400]|nr:hypothetical protein FRC18_009106 [Serendipita sp. 400]
MDQLKDHLYRAFLSGETADVLLRVSGNWNAVYKLHRIVLTQAVGAAADASHPFTPGGADSLLVVQDFFHSLFTSGFVEGNPNVTSAHNEVRIRFDHDPTITRAAFEYVSHSCPVYSSEVTHRP